MQFSYKANWSTDDVLTNTIHTVLEHIGANYCNTYASMHCVHYSSAFNAILSNKLKMKLHNLGLNAHTCNWILTNVFMD